MAEMTGKRRREIQVRYRGRGSQIFIYTGKLLRMFVYQSDWKVMPMAALIAGLVGMVTRRRIFVSMEGTLMGTFAMVCVCIWNGCFNSIQVICRERDVIKREHRSGMHISSYIISHMIYQALLCLIQTVITLYMTKLVGIRYPAEGLITRWFLVDFGISVFLITYASDMMSLWISSLSHTTTTAMTIMPFVLIFQLVFSGGMLSLPEWSKPLTYMTISNPGLKVMAAQADYNNKPLATIWTTLEKMSDTEIGGTITVGRILDLLANTENKTIQEIRNMQVGRIFTMGEIESMLNASDTFSRLKEKHIFPDLTLRDILINIFTDEGVVSFLNTSVLSRLGITADEALDRILKKEDLQPLLNEPVLSDMTVGQIIDFVRASSGIQAYKDMELGKVTTVGEIVDTLAGNPDLQAQRDKAFTWKTKLGKLLELAGKERVRDILQAKAAAASYIEEYSYTVDNVVEYWFQIFRFVILFAVLSVVTLEFIDKDKR